MELSALLERMKMEHLLAQFDGVCEHAAKGNLDYKGFLTHALEAEWRGRHRRGVESRLKLARLPWVKSQDQFDFNFQPSIDRKQVRELAGLSFVERAENVVLLGPHGVGKTHLAINVVRHPWRSSAATWARACSRRQGAMCPDAREPTGRASAASA